MPVLLSWFVQWICSLTVQFLLEFLFLIQDRIVFCDDHQIHKLMRNTVQLLQTVNIHQLISQNVCAKNSKLTKTNKGYDAVCVCVCLCACMCARKKWFSILKEHNSVAFILGILTKHKLGTSSSSRQNSAIEFLDFSFFLF